MSSAKFCLSQALGDKWCVVDGIFNCREIMLTSSTTIRVPGSTFYCYITVNISPELLKDEENEWDHEVSYSVKEGPLQIVL